MRGKHLEGARAYDRRRVRRARELQQQRPGRRGVVPRGGKRFGPGLKALASIAAAAQAASWSAWQSLQALATPKRAERSGRGMRKP
jgi:hypothetical protein